MSAEDEQTYPVVKAAEYEQKTWGLEIRPVSKGEKFAAHACPEDAHAKMAWYFTTPKETETWETDQTLSGAQTEGIRGSTEMTFDAQSAWYNVMPDELGEEFQNQDVPHGYLIGHKVCVKLAKKEPDKNVAVWAPVQDGWDYDDGSIVKSGGLSSDEVVVYRATRVNGVPHEQLPSFGETFTPLEDMGIESVGDAFEYVDMDEIGELPPAEYIDNPEDVPSDEQQDVGGGFDESVTSFEESPQESGTPKSETGPSETTSETDEPDAGQTGGEEDKGVPTEEEEIMEHLQGGESTKSQQQQQKEVKEEETDPLTKMVEADISLSGSVPQSSLKSLVKQGEFEQVEVDTSGVDVNEFGDEVEEAIEQSVTSEQDENGGVSEEGALDEAQQWDSSSWQDFSSDCMKAGYDMSTCSDLWSEVQ